MHTLPVRLIVYGIRTSYLPLVEAQFKHGLPMSLCSKEPSIFHALRTLPSGSLRFV